MNTITIQDNFIDDKHYEELTSLHIEYNKVHWIGALAKPKNALHKLVLKTRPDIPSATDKLKPPYSYTGATAWYNIRPVHPQWHNDIDSYCTKNGITYTPQDKPPYTYLYYVKEPSKGGELQLETGDLIIPKLNRLVYFPCSLIHRVRMYTGNRVSIGIIWWFDIPSELYGVLGEKETRVLDRLWEIEDERKIIKKG